MKTFNRCYRENKTNAPEGRAEDIEEGLTNFVGDWDRADFISSLVFVGLLGTVVIFAALELVGLAKELEVPNAFGAKLCLGTPLIGELNFIGEPGVDIIPSPPASVGTSDRLEDEAAGSRGKFSPIPGVFLEVGVAEENENDFLCTKPGVAYEVTDESISFSGFWKRTKRKEITYPGLTPPLL